MSAKVIFWRWRLQRGEASLGTNNQKFRKFFRSFKAQYFLSRFLEIFVNLPKYLPKNMVFWIVFRVLEPSDNYFWKVLPLSTKNKQLLPF